MSPELQIGTTLRWIMVLFQHAELYWLFNLETITQSVTSALPGPPSNLSLPLMHASMLQNRPSSVVWKQDGQKSAMFFSVRQRTPPHTHTQLHKGTASFPRSFSYCCVYEKFTQKWSHRLFWAHLWPRNDLKSPFLSAIFSVCLFIWQDLQALEEMCVAKSLFNI